MVLAELVTINGGVGSDGKGCVVKDSIHKRNMQRICGGGGWKLCVSGNLKDQCGWHIDGKGKQGQTPEVSAEAIPQTLQGRPCSLSGLGSSS